MAYLRWSRFVCLAGIVLEMLSPAGTDANKKCSVPVDFVGDCRSLPAALSRCQAPLHDPEYHPNSTFDSCWNL
jgi:hypothetical protein